LKRDKDVKKNVGLKKTSETIEKRSDFVQVKSKSGKTMMVERSRLKELLGGEKAAMLDQKAPPESRVRKVSAQATPAKQYDEVLLAEDDDDEIAEIDPLDETNSPKRRMTEEGDAPPRKRINRCA
jgi:hypothetical protein